MKTEKWITLVSESGWSHGRRVSDSPAGRIVQYYEGRTGHKWFFTTYCAWGQRGDFFKGTLVSKSLDSEGEARHYGNTVLKERT